MNLLLVAEADVRATGSGAERVLAGHVAALAARGHRVTVVSGGRGAPSVDAGVEIRRIGWSVATPWWARTEARRAVQDGAVDAVLIYHALPARWLPPFAPAPSLYLFLSSWPEEYAVRHPAAHALRRAAGMRVRHALEGRALTRATRILPMSRFMADRVRALHDVPDDRLRLVPGGVDAARFAPRDRARVRRTLGLPAAAPVVLTLRNLEPRMGVDALIDAMPGVRRRQPDAILVVGGSGPLRATLERRAGQLGLDGAVRFTGFVDEARLPDLYAAADLFVLPTQALEGFGLVTLESLACGTPVIGTPVGATPELLAPLDPGLVLPDPSAGAIEAGIVRFFARGDREALATRGRAHAVRYEWSAIAAELERVIDESRASLAAAGVGGAS